MKRLFAHVGRLWGALWFVPLIPAFYALALLAFGELRPEHVAFALVCAVLGLWGAGSRRFFLDAAPYAAVLIGYDLVRYLRPIFVTPERVIGCGMRHAELRLFSVGPDTTLQDFFARHHNPFFDVIFAIPYTIFAYLAILYAGYLFFRDRRRMRHYLLAFAVANFVSFLTWLALPAAPPWYLRAHGCVIDTSVLPNAAGLIRVDQLFGIHYYESFYSRASSIFGALPSMHCAYPLIGLLTAWRAASWRTKPVHIFYTLLMATAAMYLDHHWVIDAVAGWSVAVFATLVAGKLVDVFYAEAREPSLEPSPIGVTVNDG